MKGIFHLLKNNNQDNNYLPIDIHSHLIPGIDDGVETQEEAYAVIKKFQELGVKKIITTPHIMQGMYDNTSASISKGAELVKGLILKNNLDIEFQAAAEYYLDDNFISLIQKDDLLTFGNKYVLFETPMMDRPLRLEETIFNLASRGYKPVLAHPERYLYLANDWKFVEKLKEMGVLFQVNANSIIGYYAPVAKKIVEKLYKHRLIDFLGSDCHRMKHLDILKDTINSKLFLKISALPLKNYELAND